MITIGLVGGVASGKSIVAQSFQSLGACVLDGDRFGHEVLKLEDVRSQLVSRWGGQVLTEAGELDRSAIAKIVFDPLPAKSEPELAFLESVTHPEIERRIATHLSQLKELGRFKMAVLDAAVMLKAGWDSMCDHIIFVDAPRELREKRATLRGLNKEQFSAREAAQIPNEQKKARADIIIDNSGPPQKTSLQVEKVWQSVFEIA